MKKYVLFLVAVFCVHLSSAQVLKINQMQWDENYTVREFVKEIQSGEVIEMNTEGNVIVFDSDVINLSNTTQFVGLKLEVFNYTEGIDISVCWGACLNPWVFDFNPVELGEQGSEVFNVDYYTNTLLGSSAWVTCTFLVDDVEDFVFHIKFGDAVSSVKEPAITTNKAYPNPATSIINIDYKLNKGNAQIALYNILGVSVYEQPLSDHEGTAKINVSDFAPGIYFYTIKIDGKTVETKKVVISR